MTALLSELSAAVDRVVAERAPYYDRWFVEPRSADVWCSPWPCGSEGRG